MCWNSPSTKALAHSSIVSSVTLEGRIRVLVSTWAVPVIGSPDYGREIEE